MNKIQTFYNSNIKENEKYVLNKHIENILTSLNQNFIDSLAICILNSDDIYKIFLFSYNQDFIYSYFFSMSDIENETYSNTFKTKNLKKQNINSIEFESNNNNKIRYSDFILKFYNVDNNIIFQNSSCDINLSNTDVIDINKFFIEAQKHKNNSSNF